MYTGPVGDSLHSACNRCGLLIRLNDHLHCKESLEAVAPVSKYQQLFDGLVSYSTNIFRSDKHENLAGTSGKGCANRLIFKSLKRNVSRGRKLFKRAFKRKLERCNPWPRVANRHISISRLLSLWRHSHYDVIRYWAGHAQRYVERTYVRTDTLLRLIYKDGGQWWHTKTFSRSMFTSPKLPSVPNTYHLAKCSGQNGTHPQQ